MTTRPAIFDLIGGTPLVRLASITGPDLDLWAKAELVNPTSSHKDRIYLHMFQRAIAGGQLAPGMTVIEASTGNAGAACAMIGRLLGYPVRVVMPAGMSSERSAMIRAFGAEVEFTPGGESDQDLSLERVRQLVAAEPDRYWFPDQFSNPDNPAAHYASTGPEIWTATGGRVEALVAAVGSGGTLTGVGRYLKEQSPAIRVYAVEPAECPILSRGTRGSHNIQGIGDGFVPGNLDLDVVDGVVVVSSQQAIDTARQLALDEGLFVGISTGCNVCACQLLARAGVQSGLVVTILNDSGQKYFSSPLWGEHREPEVAERESQPELDAGSRLERYRKNWVIVE